MAPPGALAGARRLAPGRALPSVQLFRASVKESQMWGCVQRSGLLFAGSAAVAGSSRARESKRFAELGLASTGPGRPLSLSTWLSAWLPMLGLLLAVLHALDHLRSTLPSPEGCTRVVGLLHSAA